MSLLNDILEHAELAPAQLMSYIDDYESIQPYDCMISTARAVVSFFAQEYEASEKWILQALQKNPANHMNHFYYALIAKSLGQYLTAAVECWTAINFATQFGEPTGWTELVGQLNDVLTEIGPKLSPEEGAQFVKLRNILRSPGSFFPNYCRYEQDSWTAYIGDFLYYDDGKEYNDYVGFWGQSHVDILSYTMRQLLEESGNYNLYALLPSEIWKTRRTKQFRLVQKNCVLAVAATVPEQEVMLRTVDGEITSIHFSAPDIFHYVNMDQAGDIFSGQAFLVSKPIPTMGKPKKKKLILTIFMDALAQRYLTDTDFQFMPYTRAFFEKGTIFKNCYATGEWTHPSIASMSTGLYTTHHHVIYRSSAYRYPPQSKTVGEIFNEDGYFTVRISGSVGSSPYLGGLRGYDTSIQKSCMGFPDSHLIDDALNCMEAFPQSNMYMTLDLFGMHRGLEDATEYTLNLSMPQQTTISFRDVLARTHESQKSVWRQYSGTYVRKYQAALKECDQKLKRIYDYLSSHYAEDEYIVCLYSDHGTPVLNKEEYLLKQMQTNSVMMLRGGGVSAQISEEYINHIDYLPALAELAGVSFDFSAYDCVLPRVFGGPGRDFVYTESIYHGQSYKAAVRNAEYECRFETNGLTDNDGLIDLSEGFTQKILSMKTGEEIHDPELAEEFEAIVFDHIKENIRY